MIYFFRIIQSWVFIQVLYYFLLKSQVLYYCSLVIIKWLLWCPYQLSLSKHCAQLTCLSIESQGVKFRVVYFCSWYVLHYFALFLVKIRTDLIIASTWIILIDASVFNRSDIVPIQNPSLLLGFYNYTVYYPKQGKDVVFF